jgi:hypothetical protein
MPKNKRIDRLGDLAKITLTDAGLEKLLSQPFRLGRRILRMLELAHRHDVPASEYCDLVDGWRACDATDKGTNDVEVGRAPHDLSGHGK